MKTLISLLAVGVLGLSVLVFVARLHGQEAPVPASPDFTFGMVGLAPGQTARLNVVNAGSTGPLQIPCRLVLAFLDDDGNAMKQAFVQVDRGKAAFLDLTLDEAHERHGHEPINDRIEVRGIGYNPLLIESSVIPVPLSCNLIPTLEVFGNIRGTTSVILTDSVRLNFVPLPLASTEQ